jgi:hypothetical protein
MKKPPRKKPKLASNQCVVKTNQEDKPTNVLHTQPQTPKPRRLRSLGGGAWGTWKAFWAFAGPLMASTTFYSFLAPNISIESSVNLDPSQPLATQFLISNRGHLSVFDVRFSCAFNGRSVYIGHFVAGNSTLKPVHQLEPKASVTRGCAIESSDVSIPDVVVTAFYKLPLLGLETSQSAHFSVRKGAPGFFLVPGSP